MEEGAAEIPLIRNPKGHDSTPLIADPLFSSLFARAKSGSHLLVVHSLRLMCFHKGQGTPLPFGKFRLISSVFCTASGIRNFRSECTTDRKSTRLNSSHLKLSRMPSSA